MIEPREADALPRDDNLYDRVDTLTVDVVLIAYRLFEHSAARVYEEYLMSH